jgi:hypothetical protein
MRLRDRWIGVAALCAATLAPAADEPLFRQRAPIAVEQPGAFVRLPLPASAYAMSAQADLRDLRIVDARGERVPFALLVPRPQETQEGERLRNATLYPLPPRPSGSATWTSPVDVTVEGERITVHKRGGAPTPAAASPGWLIDLGDPRERPRDEPPPQSLRLQWSGPAEFSTGYGLEFSDDLRQWRRGGAGQVMALASPAGALTQPVVALGEAPARFVRLVWSDRSGAPALTGAQAVTPTQRSVTLDAPTELVLPASAAPAGKQPPDDDTKRALHYDLGAPLPIVQLDLRLAGGTQVVPARLQVRDSADQPWRPLAGAVFYRLDRGGSVSSSPPIAVQRRARYLRVVPDERAAVPDPAQTRLVAQVQLSSVVFAAQGQAPYALLAGSAHAPAGALPLGTLVPALEEERTRFGRASLGAWSEVTEAVRQAQAEQRQAAMRPWMLWAVLVVGVLALGGMVWRLARQRPAAQA